MPSQIVATIGASTSNSYVTLAEAEIYLGDRLNATEWTEADADNKRRALIQACKDIDKLRFIGIKYYTGKVGSSTHQLLKFPRKYPELEVIFDDILDEYIQGGGREKDYPFGTDNSGNPIIPVPVKNAQCEQALYLLQVGADAQNRKNLQNQGVTSFRIGNFAETFGKEFAANPICEPSVQMLGEFIDRSFRIERG